MDHQQAMDQQQAIVLFYAYISSSLEAHKIWWEAPKENVRRLYEWHQSNLSTTSPSSESNDSTKKRPLPLVGRILIAPEGINGTVSGNRRDVESYVERMKSYDDISQAVTAVPKGDFIAKDPATVDLRIFRDADYKFSYETCSSPLFPDLKISIVKEIVSTAGLVNVNDIPSETGRHLSPEEFHEILSSTNQSNHQAKEVALIDVRNTFEHEIGSFFYPKSNTKAIDPGTTTFSSFDKFCELNADNLRDKKILMYCTGGIRCEKASVLLKRRGVEDVNQLSGGIHRYLERYGNTGHFKGLNFTFDKRVAMKPNFAFESNKIGDKLNPDDKDDNDSYEVVGQCVECNQAFDELCGSRVCTVCRDLVLICTHCQSTLREYHCKRHSGWKKFYFSFLDIFEIHELEAQRNGLLSLRDEESTAKNVRRTLTRQINKVESRIHGIKDGSQSVHKNAPRWCRSCQKPLGGGCEDGKCWGFWKKAQFPYKSGNDDWTSETSRGICSSDNGIKGAPASMNAMRGRRAKQKREAEIEFLPKATTCDFKMI